MNDNKIKDMRPLCEKKTSERTEEELQRAFELYVLSKTVNGRFCPTPDLHASDGESSWSDDETPVRPNTVTTGPNVRPNVRPNRETKTRPN